MKASVRRSIAVATQRELDNCASEFGYGWDLVDDDP
jgi:hypothetical protein